MLKYFFREDFNVLKKKRLFLFFDFDGTLVPIQDEPESCSLDLEIKSYIKMIVSKHLVPVAILSGRSLKDIRKRINIHCIYYSGNHGLEIVGDDIKFIHPQAKFMVKPIKKVMEIVSKEVSHIPGVFVEDKHLTFTLHFRMADKRGKKLAKLIFYRVISRQCNSGFKVLEGKEVLELAPLVDWDKGKATEYIIKNSGQNYTPIYIGDDLTDETAFLALKEKGITIKIGRSKYTSAHYYLIAQREINKFFKKIYDIIEK